MSSKSRRLFFFRRQPISDESAANWCKWVVNLFFEKFQKKFKSHLHTRHGQRPGGDQWRNRESHSIDSDRVGEGGEGALPWRRLPFFCRLCRCHGDRNTNIQLVVMATLYFLQSTRSSSHLSIKDATTIDWSRQSIDLSLAPTHRRWLAAGPSRDRPQILFFEKLLAGGWRSVAEFFFAAMQMSGVWSRAPDASGPQKKKKINKKIDNKVPSIRSSAGSVCAVGRKTVRIIPATLSLLIRRDPAGFAPLLRFFFIFNFFKFL